MKNKGMEQLIAKVAKKVAVKSSGGPSIMGFHEPEMPEQLKKQFGWTLSPKTRTVFIICIFFFAHKLLFFPACFAYKIIIPLP